MYMLLFVSVHLINDEAVVSHQLAAQPKEHDFFQNSVTTYHRSASVIAGCLWPISAVAIKPAYTPRHHRSQIDFGAVLPVATGFRHPLIPTSPVIASIHLIILVLLYTNFGGGPMSPSATFSTASSTSNSMLTSLPDECSLRILCGL